MVRDHSTLQTNRRNAEAEKREFNSLERAICEATKHAFNQYHHITNYWLSHAPEHFLQTVVTLKLGDTWAVHPEGTRQKIAWVKGRVNKGRKPKKNARHDLVIWEKSNDDLLAIVEIKCAYSCQQLMNDTHRIKKIGAGGTRGYLLVYSEIGIKHGRIAFLDRFKNWANRLDLIIVGPSKSAQVLGEDGLIAGFCLMRAKMPLPAQ